MARFLLSSTCVHVNPLSSPPLQPHASFHALPHHHSLPSFFSPPRMPASMEEWAPHSPVPPPAPPLPPKPQHTASVEPPPRTYVVQVPKDQIYRVPPPENAYLAEHYRKHRNRPNRRSPCMSCAWWLIVALLLLFVLIALAAIIFYLVVRPGLPEFTVQNLILQIPSPPSHSSLNPMYNIIMKSDNPSAKMGFFYDNGGKAMLSHRNSAIATTEPPEFYQGYRNVTTFELHLRGSTGALPNEVESSLKGSKEVVSFSLSVEFPVRLRIGVVKLWAMRLNIDCNFGVRGMAKGTQFAPHKCLVDLR